MNVLTEWAGANPWPAVGAVAAFVALVGTAAWCAVRAVRTAERRPTVAVVVATFGALACTAYSADTSWRFAEHKLGMADLTERSVMFSAAELALFACALMARQNFHATGNPGTPGMLVWGITGVQCIPAFSESGLTAGFVRAIIGPVMAAVLWHLVMGLELRHAKPGAASTTLLAQLAGELRERLLSRFGLAVRNRDAAQITRDRWTVKAVALAARLASKEQGDHGYDRLARRLSKAVALAGVDARPEQRQMLLEQLAARRHATTLATVDLPSPWAVQQVPALATAPALTTAPVPALAAVPAAQPRTRTTVRVPAARPAGVPGPAWSDDELADHAAQSLPLIPSIRALKTSYGIGQKRAERIRADLKQR